LLGFMCRFACRAQSRAVGVRVSAAWQKRSHRASPARRADVVCGAGVGACLKIPTEEKSQIRAGADTQVCPYPQTGLVDANPRARPTIRRNIQFPDPLENDYLSLENN